MLKEDLNDISELNEQIEIALEDSNFIQLASLSSKLETIVGILTKNSHYKTNIKKANKVLNWYPMISFSKGIYHTIKSYE